MKVFRRKEEKIQIELADGTIKELVIKEQLREVIDKVFEMEIELAGQVNTRLQLLAGEITEEEIEENIADIIENKSQELLNEAMRTNNELFKVIVGDDDLEWLKNCHDSVLKEVYDVFMSVNPYYAEKKRLLENILAGLNM